jgi:hypothetical protein
MTMHKHVEHFKVKADHYWMG